MQALNEFRRADLTPARLIKIFDGARYIIGSRVFRKVFAGAIPTINRNGRNGELHAHS